MTLVKRLQKIGIGALAGALAVLAGGGAQAQDAKYPNHPVMMIVPFAPGGASDFVARIIQPGLS